MLVISDVVILVWFLRMGATFNLTECRALSVLRTSHTRLKTAYKGSRMDSEGSATLIHLEILKLKIAVTESKLQKQPIKVNKWAKL